MSSLLARVSTGTVIPLALLGLASAASADVTMTATTTVKGMGQSGDGTSVTVISGMKSRTESQLGRHTSITLLDLDERRMTVLNPKKKRAEVFDMRPMAEQQAQLQAHEVTLEPTGNSREAAGYSCDDHRLKARVEAGMEGMSVQVVMTGVVCLSQDAPGGEESAAFYQAMAERGLFLGNPEAAQAQPGRERGMTELYRKMSEKGIALISDIEVGFEGDGMMAGMLGRMKIDTQTLVTAISDAPAAGDAFSVPSNFKVKNKK